VWLGVVAQEALGVAVFDSGEEHEAQAGGGVTGRSWAFFRR
jgi:hypothetical protein